MVLVQLKDGHEYETPEENIPNIKRMFFGQIKAIKQINESGDFSKVQIGDSKKDLKPKKATN